MLPSSFAEVKIKKELCTLQNSENKKSARRDSNPRPRPWQGRAPPTEPLAHVTCALMNTGNNILYLQWFVNVFLKIYIEKFSKIFSQSLKLKYRVQTSRCYPFFRLLPECPLYGSDIPEKSLFPCCHHFQWQ